MPTGLEEAFLHPDMRAAQHLGEEPGQGFLQRIGWRAALGRGGFLRFGLWQGGVV